jgi:hypothetical protein
MKKAFLLVIIAGLALLTYAGAKKMVGYLNSNFDKKVEKQVDDRVSRIADTIPGN